MLLSSACAVAGPEADLHVFDGSRLFVLPANETLTFEHTYTWFGHSRKLRVTANPNVTISYQHIPVFCRKARTILLGPLTLHDVDAASFVHPKGGFGNLATCSHTIRACIASALAAIRMCTKATPSRWPCKSIAKPSPVTPTEKRWSTRPTVEKHLSDNHALALVPTGRWDALLNAQQRVGLMAQGFQRRLDKEGRVLPLPLPSQQLLVSWLACCTLLKCL
jgi:hypothetical protein